MIFHQQKPWSMALQVKTTKDVELCAFDIHRNKIDPRVTGLGQDCIERCDPYNFCPNVVGRGVDKIFYQSGMARSHRGKKRHLGRGARGSAGNLEYLRCGSGLSKPLTKLALWFDQNAAPASLLEHPRLRALLGLIGSHIKKKTLTPLSEKLPHQFAFRRGLDAVSNHAL
jgi:hypothetical protein